MKIDKETLASLRGHYNDGGSTEIEDVAEVLGLGVEAAEEVIPAYLAELRRKYPAEFPTPEADEEEEAEVEQKFKLRNRETGILEDLELVSHREGLAVFQLAVPTELIEIRIGGKDVTVDLLELQRLPADSQRHGVAVADLISAALLARA